MDILYFRETPFQMLDYSVSFRITLYLLNIFLGSVQYPFAYLDDNLMLTKDFFFTGPRVNQCSDGDSSSYPPKTQVDLGTATPKLSSLFQLENPSGHLGMKRDGAVIHALEKKSPHSATSDLFLPQLFRSHDSRVHGLLSISNER